MGATDDTNINNEDAIDASFDDALPAFTPPPATGDPWGDGHGEIVVGNGLVLDALSHKAEQSSAASVPTLKDSFAMLMEGAQELFSLGDFSGSLEVVEKALDIRPNDAQAQVFLQKNHETLLKMYESKLGGMHKHPRVRVMPAEIMWLNLDHRAGFVLAQIDGVLSYDEVLELSSMPRFDTCKILAKLLEEGVIESR